MFLAHLLKITPKGRGAKLIVLIILFFDHIIVVKGVPNIIHKVIERVLWKSSLICLACRTISYMMGKAIIGLD